MGHPRSYPGSVGRAHHTRLNVLAKLVASRLVVYEEIELFSGVAVECEP